MVPICVPDALASGGTVTVINREFAQPTDVLVGVRTKEDLQDGWSSRGFGFVFL